MGSSIEMAKSVLQTYDNMSSYRPNMAVDKYTAYNFSNITWSSYGPYFSQAPKMCSMELFSAKRLKSYEYTRVEELKLLLKYLYESSGKPIVLKDHLADVSLNIISRVVLTKKIHKRARKWINGINVGHDRSLKKWPTNSLLLMRLSEIRFLG